jgi:hypothetical protein
MKLGFFGHSLWFQCRDLSTTAARSAAFGRDDRVEGTARSAAFGRDDRVEGTARSAAFGRDDKLLWLELKQVGGAIAAEGIEFFGAEFERGEELLAVRVGAERVVD